MSERVLTNVLAQIAAPAANTSLRNEVDAVAAQVAPVAPEAGVRPMYAAPAEAPASRSWAIAASVALLLSLLGNALLYTNWKSASSELVALQNENSRFATTTTVVEKKLDDLRQENQVLRNDEFHAVALAGTKAAPSAHARVLFNAATHKVYVDVRSLPALPAGKQYQLWALDKGKPIDAGVLTVATATGEGLQHMKDIASAQTFAMTVEPAGGSVNPTLTTMTVVGNI
nr:anti-sigma factor [Hymenobacter negativus]